MKLNRYTKALLIFLAVIVVFILIIAAWFWWMGERRHRSYEEDRIKYAKCCDTISMITEKPSIGFSEFPRGEVEELRFYLIRHNRVLKDTTIRHRNNKTPDYLWTEIPFDRFLKTDTVMVETSGNDKRYYYISGFHYTLEQYYGMFGYTGIHECHLAKDDYRINGKQSDGTIYKRDGSKSSGVLKTYFKADVKSKFIAKIDSSLIN